MVVRLELVDDDVDRIFHALADATRRDILRETMQRRQSVTALAQRYDMSFAAVQKHVAVLERAQLVSKERNGREQLVIGDPATLKRATELLDQLEQLWRHRVDAIADILSTNKRKKGQS